MDRFWDKVDKRGPDECWEWMGYKHPRGYGMIRLGGKKKYAHRISWELENGKIGPGMCVCHSCDTPSCVNPLHLFLGTQKENIEDMDNKGRRATGNNHGAAKLNGIDVQLIRHLIKNKCKQRTIACAFGVSESEISRIKTRERWK